MNDEVLRVKWQDYLFLTEEMKKFLQKNELDMFLSLLDQREAIQKEIQTAKEDHPFYVSPEGRALLCNIQQANHAMMMAFQMVFNGLRKRENISNAYEGMVSFTGTFLNRNT